MSTALHESRYAAVTPLPIVVSALQLDMEDPEINSKWTYELLEGFGEWDFIELPPDAYASVIALDRAAIRKLGRQFDVTLSPAQIADLFAFAKLIDAVRLAGDQESRKLCLLALEQASGKEARDSMERAFAGTGKVWCDAEHVRDNKFTWHCFCARLGLIYPKERAIPQVAIVTPNLIEGLKLQIVLSLHQARATSHCQVCGSAYIRHRQEQKFCSERCASRERQARFRANHMKGAKHG